MGQKGNNSDNISVEGEFSNSPLTINQKNRKIYIINRDIAPFTQLKADPDSIQHYPEAEIRKRAARGGIGLVASFVMVWISTIDSVSSLLSSFGVLGYSRFFAISIAVALVLLSGDYTYLFLHWYKMKVKSNRTYVQIMQRFLEVDNEGNCITYSASERCIYPNCRGIIVPVDVPAREKHRYQCVGVCSLEDKHHSYVIDNNSLAARPKELDWRPRNPTGPNSGYN